MSAAPHNDPKIAAKPKSEPILAFPDYGSLIEAMNRARADGDEALRSIYRPRYEIAKMHGEGWMAHAPMLAAVVATARAGAVLEIGVGRGSTPLLVEMCRAMGREYVGLDKDPSWCEEMRDVLAANIIHMPDWGRLPNWVHDSGKSWSVAFIDNDPTGRLPCIMAMRDHVEFLVVHDTWNMWEELRPMHEFLDTFQWRSDYTLMPSCTSVVSDVRPYAGSR